LGWNIENAFNPKPPPVPAESKLLRNVTISGLFFFPGDEQPFTSSFEGTRVFDPWPKSIKQFYDDLV
jgi:hypothetical protein